MVYCFKSASLRSNEQVPSLKLRTLGAKLGNRLDLTQKLHQKCREARSPFAPIYPHSTYSMQNLLLVSEENESHSCSKQKTEDTTHGDNHSPTIRQPLNNHWTIIEQSLNNHWTNPVQTLFKSCLNPSNIRVVLWNETHRFEKPNPVVWGIIYVRLPDGNHQKKVVCWGLTAKLVPRCPQKGTQEKIWNRLRVRGARFHLSNLYVFQGYMHFLQILHSSGLNSDKHRG